VIKTFADKNTKEFWDTGKSQGMPPANLRSAAKKKLAMLHSAARLEDLRVPPGNRLERLRHDRVGQHSIRINDQFRVCFVWRDGDAFEVEITDYHWYFLSRSFTGGEIVSIKNEGPAGWAVHPGEILREEFLEPMGISAYRLAVELHVSPPTVNDIVREKRGITPEMAARLAKYFGTSEQFWLNLQDAFAVHQVRRKYSKELKAIRPLAAAVAR
jgi:addiction module HigA family antidote